MISNTTKSSKDGGYDDSSAASISSTEAKASIRELIQRAKRSPVFVTIHKKREAVVMSVDEYEQLLANQRDPLADMAQHFDALVAKMQTSEHAVAVDALFNATPAELGEAAAKAARIG